MTRQRTAPNVSSHIRLRAARPAEAVFDFVSDLRNETSWNPRALRLDKVTSGPVGPRTVFHGRYRGIGRLDTMLVEYDRPHRVAFRSHGRRLSIDGAFTLTQTGDLTDVALEAVLRPRGVLKLLAPLLKPTFRRQNAAAAVRLRHAIEAQRH